MMKNLMSSRSHGSHTFFKYQIFKYRKRKLSNFISIYRTIFLNLLLYIDTMKILSTDEMMIVSTLST